MQDGGEQPRTKFAGKLVGHESLHVLSGNQYYARPSYCGGNFYCFKHICLWMCKIRFFCAQNIGRKCYKEMQKCSVPSGVLETIWFFVCQNLSCHNQFINLYSIKFYCRIFVDEKFANDNLHLLTFPHHYAGSDRMDATVNKKKTKKTEWYTTLVPFC